MNDLYSRLSYTFSGFGGFFSGSGILGFFGDFSIYEWGFLIGLIASISLGVMTYQLNRREQMKRTRILERYFSRHPISERDIENIVKVTEKSPKDL
ncbi:TPA: potassium channel protein [Providencia stuartii]|uniref:potassium channel protein n=1 Tax=Providencia stuartii TaxID=588 RepID=UPI0009754894|nr:potassium channel protein [Providencia stuartii]UQZ10326.1 potassium channel protein [Providencia stuartii]HEM8865036.1 potassium channel protein [Providencia stuartii]